MKHFFCMVFFIAISFSGYAQKIPRASIEDSVIGWMKVCHFKGLNEPLKVDAKVYSAAQLSKGNQKNIDYEEIVSLNPDYFNKSLGAEVPQLIMLHLAKGSYPHMKKVADLIQAINKLITD